MERKPPTTRTKDDANKELHDIELLINAKKNELEIIHRDIADGELDRSIRISKCKKREEECEIKIEKYNKCIEGQVVAIKKNDSDIFTKNEEIESLIASLGRMEVNYDIVASKQEVDSLSLKTLIESLQNHIESINTNRQDRELELENVNVEIRKLKLELESLVLDINARTISIEEKEKILAQKQYELEVAKSTIRVYAIRFQEKFKDKITPHILKETTII